MKIKFVKFGKISLIIQNQTLKRSHRPIVSTRRSDGRTILSICSAGRIDILTRGPGQLNCWEGVGDEGSMFLNNLRSATRTSSLLLACKKLDLDVVAVMNQLFELFCLGELQFVKSPAQSFIIRRNELSDAMVEQILERSECLIANRLDSFREFVSVIGCGN